MTRDLILERTFRAPIALVWQLWTEPAYVAMWWGIRGCAIPVCELDVRPGGLWRIDMRTPDGTVYRNGGRYVEVEPERRLVYSDIPDAATNEWEGDVPGTRQNSVRFAPHGDGTHLSIAIRFATAADHERFLGFGIDRGIAQSLDKLEALLADMTRPAPG